MPTVRPALLSLLALSFVLTSPCAVAQRVIATVATGSTPVALAINLTTSKIYTANKKSHNVTVIDGVTNGTTFVNVGLSPSALAVNSATNKIYVVNHGDSTASVIDGATSTNTATVATGSAPGAVAVNPTTNKIYVANWDSSLTVIDGATNFTTTLAAGPHSTAVAVNPVTNKIYVANAGNGTVTVVDGQTNSVATISVGSFPYALAVNSLTNRIYVANFGDGTVSVIDGTNSTVIATVTVGVSPASIVVDPVTNTIYVANYGDGTVSAIDGISNVTTATVVGRSPYSIMVDPVTDVIYTANFIDGTVSAVDGVDHSVATVTVGANPDAVVVNPVTNRVYVANSGDSTVSVIADANSNPLQFIPMTPCRVADTRNPQGPFGGPPLSGGISRDFAIPASACSVPSTAAAYALNITVVPGGRLGYLTVWPAGQNQPTVSTLNSLDGRVKANAAIVPAGTGGAVSVFATNTTNVILDINGYFAPVTDSTLAFYPLQPCRVADTRWADGPLGGPVLPGGTSRDFPLTLSTCKIPVSPQAYSLNFTVVPRGILGFLTTWPAGQDRPLVSTLNAPTGVVTANAAIVPAGSGGDIEVYVSNDSDVVIDINGYFASPATGGLSLHATAPCRVLDTRPNGFSGTIRVNVDGSLCGLPTGAQAFVVNATVVPKGSLGYLTLWPDGGAKPLVSTLNASDGAITSNMAIVPTTNGWIDAFASNPTQLLLDSFSYFGP